MHLVWFKRDLRAFDHAPLANAAKAGPTAALYVAEPEYWALPDTSARQWGFITECLMELEHDLAALGLPLTFRQGDVKTILDEIHAKTPITVIYSHEETGNQWTYERDKRVSCWARLNNITWTEFRQFGVTRGSTKRDGWGQRWDKTMALPLVDLPKHVICALPLYSEKLPKASDLGLDQDLCPGRQIGGRSNAKKILNEFLHDRGQFYHKQMSSPGLASTSCSRLSPYLSTGVISMKEVAQATRARLAEIPLTSKDQRHGWRLAMRAFWARLHWHCHFVQKLEDSPHFETKNVHSDFDDVRAEDDPYSEYLVAWSKGQTGFPFLDACQRSLNSTGWINFRMRAMIMAFASYHLWLNWRQTGLHLARKFTDYEPGIHWNQVQMQSGTTGINAVRIYNPVKQGCDHDPTGTFIRHWVPELKHVKTVYIHEPWEMPLQEQLAVGCVLGSNYPERILDHEKAARVARQRIFAIRKTVKFKEESRHIHQKHGSRKKLPAAPRRPRRQASHNAAQGTMDL